MMEYTAKNHDSLIAGAMPEQVCYETIHDITDTMIDAFEVISFDCFDTLLWRSVDKPVDVFYELQHHPLFKQFGLTADQRMKSEAIARQRKQIKKNSKEVSLIDIYRTFNPAFTDNALIELMQAELELEKRYCYPFLPMIELVQRILKKGKRVSIVSDTYFSSLQLKSLLSEHLGSDLVDQFDQVIVSCENDVSKSDGLHEISKQKHKTIRMLHVGDHEIADVRAAKAAGLSAIHLHQYDEVIQTLNRLRNNMISVFDAEVRQTKPLYTPYKTFMAIAHGHEWVAETMMGYACLGPLMVSFARDIRAHYDERVSNQQTPKLLFLLRDGHLPHRVFQTLYPEIPSYAVRISRFASYAASFNHRDAIDHYLADVMSGKRYADITKQLLFNEDEIKSLMKRIESSKDSRAALIAIIHEKKNVDLILERSRAYRERLMNYLRKTANIASGDTLLLVDLGYSGTTQTKLTPVLNEEYHIQVYGHYLLSLSVPLWKETRRGLIDPSVADENTLQSLVMYIALLEQLCTTTDRSVIDFDQEGHPILGEASIHPEQHAVLTKVQEACVSFASMTLKHPEYLKIRHRDALVQTAIGELARLIFMPLPMELTCLKKFKFDLNLGTKELFDMFDAERGVQGLRERGLFFMEKNLTNMRTNYPAELRYAGLPLSLTLLTQHRHALSIHLTDMTYRHYDIPVIMILGSSNTIKTLKAQATFDGYYSLIIPANQGDLTAGILFGKKEKLFQLLSVQLIEIHYWNTDTESLHTENIQDQLSFEKLQAKEDQVYECLSDEACLVIKPKQMKCANKMIYRVIFRPMSY